MPTKISELTATTALTGAESIPLVQSGVTKRTTLNNWRPQVADYTALRAYTGTSKEIYVTGYQSSTAPSGIAGLFTCDDSDVSSSDNSGTIIVASNGKRWKRLFTGPADVKWFGAKGDSVTDDTVAVQAAGTAHNEIEFTPSTGDYLVGNLSFTSSKRLVVRNGITHSTTGAMITAVGSVGSTYTATGAFTKSALSIDLTSVTGLAVGDYLSITETSPGFGSMHRITAISGVTVTLDRGLEFDITAATTIKEITPITFTIEGDRKNEITLSNTYPRLFSGQYLLDTKVRGLRIKCTGSALTSDVTVVYTILVQHSFGGLIAENDIYGMAGGSEFSPIGVASCSGITVKDNLLRSITGQCRGIGFLYSSGIIAQNNKLFGVPGSGVGAIFCYYTIGMVIEGNLVAGTVYNGINTSGSCIQITESHDGVVSGNWVRDAFGVGCIYISSNSKRINIVGNHVSRNVTGTHDHLGGIILRSGEDISVFGNHINYTTDQIPIWVRGINRFKVADNYVRTSGSTGIWLDKAGSDAVLAQYYPRNGSVTGNEVIQDTAITTSFAAYQIGSLADNIKISDNDLTLTCTSTTAANKWMWLINGTNIDFCNNNLTATFDVASTSNFPFQWIAASSGLFDGNICRWTNHSARLSTAGANWKGGRNRFPNQAVIGGLRGGAATYVSEVSETALRYGITANRPTLTADDLGFMYRDTTTGTIVTWSGAAWV